jgi:carbamoyltransferase
VRNEPIVCSPEDAYRCFMRTAIDILVLENCVLYKSEQKPLEDNTSWQQEFEPD